MTPTTLTGKPQKTDQRIEALTDVLAATDGLYRRTHLAHWNIRGPHFPTLHRVFEEQYQELWNALDTLAERARALGGTIPVTALGDPAAGGPDLAEDAGALVRGLAEGHRALSARLAELEALATDSNDPATADLAVSRIRSHDQFAWMLEATAEGWA